ADEKVSASSFLSCGGGPAANAAVTVARLGYKAAFCGSLGHDTYGELHSSELAAEGVELRLLVRSAQPTPLSVILVKPDGSRSVVNYSGKTAPLARGSIDFSSVHPKAVLFDGHEPDVSLEMAEACRKIKVPLILDAGSVHRGTTELLPLVDYAVCSEKFARQFTGGSDIPDALHKIGSHCPCVIITRGAQGLFWRHSNHQGSVPAYSVDTVDTTGAGDVFHGAFALGVALAMDWPSLLNFASAAAALSCTKLGARPSIPVWSELDSFMEITGD
ncbi:MAG TPA: PfkB family carbohydrate kinase, partial [Oligoflexia bacterium]|nr:PfkB family carbohydrate kinase [Oligoflexia bacterium]